MFSDKDIKPDDDLIFRILKEKKVHWLDIMNHMKDVYHLSSGDWHYYNDGKQWLFKMVLKKKTIFWAGLFEDSFRVTFYFGDKALPLIEESSLPEEIKNDFKTGKKYGAIRGVTIKVNNGSDVEHIKNLIVIKNKLK
jgi:hypothetical protein